MIHRPRRLGAVVLSIGCMCAVTACGSSSKSSSGSSGSPSGRGTPVGFKLTSAQQSCLKKKGVTLPTGGFQGGRRGARPNGASANGTFPKRKATNGKLPKGKFRKGAFPKGATPPAGMAKQFAKRQAAMKACGVSFPSQGAPPAAG